MRFKRGAKVEVMSEKIMRFKRGAKVEVMSEKGVLISWKCAEIISGNGHTYSVRYDCYPGSTSEVAVERVSRKAIRPCPPHVEGLGSWVAGDVVEILDCFSWKIATVLRILDRDHHLVRLLGVPQEFRVHKSNIRVRQSWEDNKWVVIGKGSRNFEEVKSTKKTSFQMLPATTKIKLQGLEDHFTAQDDIGLHKSHFVFSRTLKRASPYCSSPIDAYAGNVHKVRAIKKEGRQQRFVPTFLREKVDVSYQRQNRGEKYIRSLHSSSNNKSNGYYKTEREKLSVFVGRSDDSDSDASSVGSCSITRDSPNKNHSNFAAVPCQEKDSLSSYAESFYGSGNQKNCHFPPNKEVAASIHRLELHAYRCTLEALYASGPLSWEQEAMLTNLRITLHISNDEHLTELKNLIFGGTSIHFS